jgi:transcriptional regulator with XRE-family HTH domain
MTGSELKAMRERAGLTQKQLAEKSGVTTSTIGRYESEIRTITAAMEKLLKLILA